MIFWAFITFLFFFRYGAKYAEMMSYPRLFLLSTAIGLSLFLDAAESANWYVRPTSAGANTGTDWNNAWNISSLNSGWSSVQPGDTVWLAGGTYTSSLVFSKSGSSGNEVYVKRVLSTDAIPTAAVGWNPAFDAQVVIRVSSGNVLTFKANYINVDGRVADGIKLHMNHTGAGNCALMSNQNNITLRYLEMQGPGASAILTGFQTNWGAGYASKILTSHVNMHGCNQNVTINFSTDCVFEYCDLHDSGCGNSGDFHPNMVEYCGSSKNTFRYCTFRSWPVVGFMLWQNVGSLYIYGCIIRDVSGGSADFLWPSGTGAVGGDQGPVILYNNTFVNAPLTIGRGNTLVFGPGSVSRNNIFYDTKTTIDHSGNWLFETYGYNFTNLSSGGGMSGITNGSNPFVDLTNRDLHIISTITATLPRDKGFALSAPYNVDRDGMTRGGDGKWDIGAYENATSSGSSTLEDPSFAASAGTITSPFVVDSNGDVSQPVETTVSTGGRASYAFLVSTPGDYTITAVVNAPNSGADSFFVNIDAEPTDPIMIWDILPLTSGLESRTISWRGNGTFNSPQYASKRFSLSEGSHQLIIRGREANVLLRNIAIVPAGPSAPTGLRISMP